MGSSVLEGENGGLERRDAAHSLHLWCTIMLGVRDHGISLEINNQQRLSCWAFFVPIRASFG